MWFPVEFPTPSEHFVQRTLTPQATGPQTKGLQIPFSWRTSDLKSNSDVTTSGQSAKTSTLARVQKRNLGLAVSPSSGIWFSALFNEELNSARNARESNASSGMFLYEEFLLREAVARVGFDLLNNLQLGFGLRSQSVRGDVVGNFSQGTEKRVVYSGSRLGIVAGALVNSAPFQLALRYETPVSGKVEIQAESKVSSSPGYTGAALQYALNSDVALLAEYGFYNVAKNELASTLPLANANNNATFLPLGGSVDARVVPLKVLGAGLSYKLGSAHKLQVDAVQGQVYSSADPELLVPSEVPEEQKQKVNLLRLGLAVEKSDWESQVFADYSTSKISYNLNSTNKVTRSFSSWGIGLRAGVEL